MYILLSIDDEHQGKTSSKDYDVEDDDLSDDESNGDGIGYNDVQSNGFQEHERDNSDEAEDDDDDDDFRDDDDGIDDQNGNDEDDICLLYTSPSPRDQRGSRMPSSA